jgi:hypothetical protein
MEFVKVGRREGRFVFIIVFVFGVFKNNESDSICLRRKPRRKKKLVRVCPYMQNSKKKRYFTPQVLKFFWNLEIILEYDI